MKSFSILISLIFCIFHHIYFNVSVNEHRNIPKEPDDSYHHILKVSNLESSLNNETIGLQSIFEQTQKETNDLNEKFIKDRQAHRILLSYHPAYTILFYFAMKIFDLEYEKIHFIFEIIGTLFLCFAAALFLNTFFTKSVTAITLLYFSISISNYNHIIHFPIPFNLATGCVWIMLSSWINNYKKKYILYFIFNFLACSLHPSGIILSLISLLFIFINDKAYSSKKLIFFLFLNFVVVLFLYFNRIKFIDNDFHINSFYFQSSIISAVFSNALSMSKLVISHLLKAPLFLYSTPLFIIMIIALRFDIFNILKFFFSNRKNLVFLLCMICLILISLLYPAPFIQILDRTFAFLYLPLVGIYFHVLLAALSLFLKKLKKRALIFTVSLILCLLSIAVVKSYDHYNKVISYYKYRDNVTYSEFQQNFLKNNIKKDEIVYISTPDEMFLYYFLSKSGSNILNISELISKNNYTKDINKIKYVFSKSPNYFKYELNKDMSYTGDLMFLSNGDSLTFNYSEQIKKLKFFFQTHGNSSEIEVMQTGEKLKLDSMNGWMEIQIDSLKTKNISLKLINSEDSQVRIMGIRANDQSNLFWPWDKGVLSFKGKTISFNKNDLLPPSLNLIEIIDDFGGSVLTLVSN